MATLEIIGEGLNGSNYDIYYDGMKMETINRLELDISAGEVNHATIHFSVDEVKMSGDVIAALEAIHYEEKKKGNQ